jgi:quercetin 2,3-dioxygenase
MKYFPEEPYTEAGSGPDNALPGERKAYFLRAGEGPRHLLFGQVAFQLMTGAESGGRLGMTVTEGPRGAAIPTHVHTQTYEAIYCLDGRLRVNAEGEEHLLTRGDFMSIPAGVEHTFAMEAHLTRFATMYGPAGLERLHEVAGAAAEQPIFPERAEPVDRDRLAAAAAELDIAFVS